MITDVLRGIQQTLKAPKGQYHEFGKYNYRSCEDILEAVKPLLGDAKVTLTLSDEIVEVGGRVYVKATATLRECGIVDVPVISVTAYAREEESKKGMDASQVTGAASSYARKYALNGLFCIDDTKDADATNTHGKETPAPAPKVTKRAAETPRETYPEQETLGGLFCEECGAEITDAERKYSTKYFKRPLCRECQKNAR